MSLDFSPLKNSIDQLEKSLKYSTSELAQSNPDLFEQFRNSVIQCFEFTYELSHKMLKRFLEATSANPEEVDLASFQDLIRSGNEKALLRSDWTTWKIYRQARTDSRHTYDAQKAASVYQIAPDFLLEAQHLYRQLVERSARG